MRLWPRSLAGQLTVMLVIALVVAQTLAIFLFAGERAHAFRTAYRENVVGRTAALMRLVESTPGEAHDGMMQAASSQFVRFALSDEPELASEETDARTEEFAGDLAAALEIERARVRVALTEEDYNPLPRFDWWSFRKERHDFWQGMSEEQIQRWREWRERRREQRAQRERVLWIAFSIAMPDGKWLNGQTGPAPLPPPFGALFLTSLFLSLIAVAATGLLVARRITRPMRRLAAAADRVGRGEVIEPLKEQGPDEVRRGVRAFNEMQERLNRFVRDRTHMLAAISHDLRTPLTSLRLRAEMVDDEEMRQRMVATIDEMTGMIDATLDFVRSEGRREDTRDTDLAGLAETVAGEFNGRQARVRVAADGPVSAPVRPMALKRALRNVIENAVHYGGGAAVRLERDAGEVRILVEDDGPGLPEEDLDSVFEPFVRGETSRSRDTGGVGLGLAIARTILRGHGGEARLENRTEGGLRAVLTLPLGAAIS